MTDQDVELTTPAREVVVDEIAAREEAEDERRKAEHYYSGGVLDVTSPFIHSLNCDQRSHLLTAVH
jgi:hypothetical protein